MTKCSDEGLLLKAKEQSPQEAIKTLDVFLANHPDNEDAFLLRGMKHWAMGNRALAIKDYLAALRINPESKAKLALENANAILNYYNKDLLNP